LLERKETLKKSVNLFSQIPSYPSLNCLVRGQATEIPQIVPSYPRWVAKPNNIHQTNEYKSGSVLIRDVGIQGVFQVYK